MQILFICGNGVSSGMIASRTESAGIEKGYDAHTDAYSYTQLEDVIDDFDVVMVAPQIQFQEPLIKEICEEHKKPYALIDPTAYSMLDGTKVFEQAITAVEKGE